ncbi:MAG TPA: hypothetical protein VGC22_14670 [Chitinophaga sp.]
MDAIELTTEQQRNVFSAALGIVAGKFYQATTTPEFAATFFPAFQAAGLEKPTIDWIRKDIPSKVKSWLKDILKNQFRSVAKPPRWVDEPYWVFYENRPMVFQQQVTLPEADDMEGGELYIFSIVHPTPDGAGKMQSYRMIKQTKKGEGTELITYLPFTDKD